MAHWHTASGKKTRLPQLFGKQKVGCSKSKIHVHPASLRNATQNSSTQKQLVDCKIKRNPGCSRFSADAHDTKQFYESIRTMYGPREKANAPRRDKERHPLSNISSINQRWVEHYGELLNRDSAVSDRSLQKPFTICKTAWNEERPYLRRRRKSHKITQTG